MDAAPHRPDAVDGYVQVSTGDRPPASPAPRAGLPLRVLPALATDSRPKPPPPTHTHTSLIKAKGLDVK